MKLLLNKALAAIVLLTAGCSTRPAVHGIPNFSQVGPYLYRGGEPNAEGWAYLRSLGVTQVVKLNSEPSLPNGLKTIYCPISFPRQLLFEPKMSTVTRAVDCIPYAVTFVHCAHGEDRTGLVVAEYRVWDCGWTRDAARKEMLEHGFHRSLFGLDLFWKTRRWWERSAKDCDCTYP